MYVCMYMCVCMYQLVCTSKFTKLYNSGFIHYTASIPLEGGLIAQTGLVKPQHSIIRERLVD